MTDSDIRFLIRREIERAMNIILHGTVQGNTVQTEDIGEMFPGMPTILNRPVMHPYGLSSRAPLGILSVVARVGEHCGNRMVIGHRDKDKPSLESGESCLYNQYGQRIYMKNGEIRIGTMNSQNPVPLGNELKQALSDMLQALISHTHVCSAPGVLSSPPANAAAFTAIKASPVDDKKMLSDLTFTEKGG